MFSFLRKAILLGVAATISSGFVFALDSSSSDKEQGVTVHLPELTNVAQNIPDAPIMPVEDEMPGSNSIPEPSPDMQAPPMMSSSMENSMNTTPTMAGNFNPGWRPLPNPETFPRNPFSGVATMETPVAFKQEFDALAKNIIGFVEVGKNSVLIVQNRVVREGDTVKLVKEVEKGTAIIGNDAQAQQEGVAATAAIFAGVDKKKEVAKFMLGDIEVHVPIPSTRKKIEDANGEVSRIEGLATATFLGEKGYFVVASDLVPEVDPQKKIYIKTQFGAAVISIVKRDEATSLALGRVESLNMLGLFNGIKWTESKDSLEKSLASILAFDVEKVEGVSRPRLLKLSSYQANPKWVSGCPAFFNQEFLGVLGKKDGKLTVVGQDELKNLFPDAFVITQDDKQKAEGLTPSQLKTEEADFFNPEKIVGLVYMETVD